jgi:hypothetical protein
MIAPESVAEVWVAYSRHHPRSVPSDERMALIERRLKDHSVEDLIDAIEGNHLDSHCNGQNVRHREYHDLGLILRNADHIERYGAIARNGVPQTTARKAWETAQQLRAVGE